MTFFAARAKEQTASEILAKEVYAVIADLPQFVYVNSVGYSTSTEIPRDGQLNMLNGCLVSLAEGGLRLTWQLPEHLAPAHSARLADVEAIGKFLELMKRQAAV